jgi:hypothetical protein
VVYFVTEGVIGADCIKLSLAKQAPMLKLVLTGVLEEDFNKGDVININTHSMRQTNLHGMSSSPLYV